MDAELMQGWSYKTLTAIRREIQERQDEEYITEGMQLVNRIYTEGSNSLKHQSQQNLSTSLFFIPTSGIKHVYHYIQLPTKDT
jgi:hypothetical protein